MMPSPQSTRNVRFAGRPVASARASTSRAPPVTSSPLVWYSPRPGQQTQMSGMLGWPGRPISVPYTLEYDVPAVSMSGQSGQGEGELGHAPAQRVSWCSCTAVMHELQMQYAICQAIRSLRICRPEHILAELDSRKTSGWQAMASTGCISVEGVQGRVTAHQQSSTRCIHSLWNTSLAAGEMPGDGRPAILWCADKAYMYI